MMVAAAVPAQTPAQIESTPIPTQVKPNFASMNFMIGTWNCSTKSSRRPGPYMTVSTYSIDPTGYWIVETSTTAPTAWVPTKLVFDDKITYDPDTKRWVDVLSGDQGAYGLIVSRGWVGNQIVWHDLGFAPTSQIRSQTNTTTTKESDTKMVSRSTFTEAKTGRVVTVVGTCTKS
ncbi:MAG: hypothetical protein JOZ01_01245 [Candidatus Eremiobacteraeota bacterium]|nr:hypothetical protein [Candidatus Eremiobacteraeota bacterium]